MLNKLGTKSPPTIMMNVTGIGKQGIQHDGGHKGEGGGEGVDGKNGKGRAGRGGLG